ncbi:MAG: hypothetical protein LBG19_04375 [Prevotellaceae bacterium]|jgi:hypothetical protein|nr:hypothetical protein [Prevotellaceae bacterium]
METRYCVFWIPSTGHKEPAILPKVKSNKRLARRTVDISDGYSAKNIPGQKVWLRTRIDVQNELKRDIRVTYLSEKKQNPRKFDKKDIVLEYIDACRNGMLLYKYRFNNSCPLELAIDKAMPFAVYHLIKGYFHEHEYHSEEKDSLLEAYIQPTRINIKKCDNEALIFYLKGFEEQFAFYNKTLRNNLYQTNEDCAKLKSKLDIDENNEAKEKSKLQREEDLANLYNIVQDKRKKYTTNALK